MERVMAMGDAKRDFGVGSGLVGMRKDVIMHN